jgi:hypothetical protein
MIMKYLIEIETESEKGSELIKYIESLGLSKNDMRVINEPPLTDEEMGLPPTRKVSRETLEAWLKPEDDEESFTMDEALEYIRNKKEAKAKGNNYEF